MAAFSEKSALLPGNGNAVNEDDDVEANGGDPLATTVPATVNRIVPIGGGDYDDDSARSNVKSRRRVAVGIIALALSLIAVAIVLGVTLANDPSTSSLQNAVRTPNIFSHLDQFNVIATQNGLNSRSVRNNYNSSADYVIRLLTNEGVCEPQKQYLVVPVHEELATPKLVQTSPQSISYIYNVDYIGMRYGGNGTFNFTTELFVVPNGGCSVNDFAGIAQGQIVAADEGTCDVVYKALNAQQAGAGALLQFNLPTSTSLRNTRVRYVNWTEGDPLVQIPVFSVSYSVGATLKQLSQSGPAPVLSLFYSALLTLDYTYNIICDTNPAATSNIVMLGAHLDSVPEGPGLDDNASGSSTVLELAIQYNRLGFKSTAINAVRFAWWGAEEIGLLGSRHYVRELQKAGKVNELALYLNYDMLGAPNYTPQIHNGNQVNSNIPEDVQASSTIIQGLYEQYFTGSGLPFAYASMTGGSDYLPFLEAGVPSGGMATGASALKTASERELFGGFANAAYDPCYHLSCDTVLNVSFEGLRQCSEAAAQVLQKLAFQQDIQSFLNPPSAASNKDL